MKLLVLMSLLLTYGSAFAQKKGAVLLDGKPVPSNITSADCTRLGGSINGNKTGCAIDGLGVIPLTQ